MACSGDPCHGQERFSRRTLVAKEGVALWGQEGMWRRWRLRAQRCADFHGIQGKKQRRCGGEPGALDDEHRLGCGALGKKVITDGMPMDCGAKASRTAEETSQG